MIDYRKINFDKQNMNQYRTTCTTDITILYLIHTFLHEKQTV